MRFQISCISACFAVAAPLPVFASDFLLKPSTGGGYVIERSAAEEKKSAHGLATVADLISLLRVSAAAPQKIDFAAGKKLEGAFTITVGREDGTLGRYEGASEVIIFTVPDTVETAGDLTTFAGAVVFTLKIDNSGTAAAVQRFETGAISLAPAGKSL
jgi:hypothetical protein